MKKDIVTIVEGALNKEAGFRELGKGVKAMWKGKPKTRTVIMRTKSKIKGKSAPSPEKVPKPPTDPKAKTTGADSSSAKKSPWWLTPGLTAGAGAGGYYMGTKKPKDDSQGYKLSAYIDRYAQVKQAQAEDQQLTKVAAYLEQYGLCKEALAANVGRLVGKGLLQGGKTIRQRAAAKAIAASGRRPGLVGGMGMDPGGMASRGIPQEAVQTFKKTPYGTAAAQKASKPFTSVTDTRAATTAIPAAPAAPVASNPVDAAVKAVRRKRGLKTPAAPAEKVPPFAKVTDSRATAAAPAAPAAPAVPAAPTAASSMTPAEIDDLVTSMGKPPSADPGTMDSINSWLGNLSPAERAGLFAGGAGAAGVGGYMLGNSNQPPPPQYPQY